MEMYNKLFKLIKQLLSIIYDNGLELDSESKAMLEEL